MEVIPGDIQAFADKYTSAEADLLYRLHRETYLKVDQPHMLSGHVQGVFLSMVSHMMRPRRILEIGTYTGYSAICLAQGLAPDGMLHTIDINEELEDMAARYIAEAGLTAKITQHIGKAAGIIRNSTKPLTSSSSTQTKPDTETTTTWYGRSSGREGLCWRIMCSITAKWFCRKPNKATTRKP